MQHIDLITIDGGPIEKRYPSYYTKETMESNVTNLYLADVICGDMDTHTWFIKNPRIHATTILRAIVKKTS